MPTYNYKCNECDFEFSIFHTMSHTPVSHCDKCNGENSVKRIITGGTGMIFKGDGFYITDYKKNNDNQKNKKKEKKNNKKNVKKEKSE